MITCIHMHIEYWFDGLCGSNTFDQDMARIKLWFAKILTFFITSLKPNYETDDIDVSMICLPLSFYMCFYLEIANNPVCKTSGAFFLFKGKAFYGTMKVTTLIMKMDFKRNLSCNNYKLDYLIELIFIEWHEIIDRCLRKIWGVGLGFSH